MKIKGIFTIQKVEDKSNERIRVADVTLSKTSYKGDIKEYVVKAFKNDVGNAENNRGQEVFIEMVLGASKNGYASSMFITEIRGLKASQNKGYQSKQETRQDMRNYNEIPDSSDMPF